MKTYAIVILTAVLMLALSAVAEAGPRGRGRAGLKARLPVKPRPGPISAGKEDPPPPRQPLITAKTPPRQPLIHAKTPPRQPPITAEGKKEIILVFLIQEGGRSTESNMGFRIKVDFKTEKKDE